MSVLPGGSIPWLLGHELRLAWRGFGSGGRTGPNGKRKGGRNRGLVIALVLLAVVGAAAVSLLPQLHILSRMQVRPNGWLVMGVSVGMVFVFSLMLAQSLNGATIALYERNDLDLLLSSPMPPRTVLTVRALGVAVMACLTYLVLSSLFVIPMAVMGQPQWLAIYAVLIALALLASSGGLAIAMGLFALIGPRRTRTVAQVLAALLGASLFLAGQARNFLPKHTLNDISARIASIDPNQVDVSAPYAWPTLAVMGQPLPLISICAFALLLFLFVTASLGRKFGQDAAAAAGSSVSGRAQAVTQRKAARAKGAFGGGPFDVLFRKEMRLLLRDPWLISQILLQTIYILPLGFTLWRAEHSSGELAMTAGASAICFIGGQLAGNLTWITASAEDAPELIASAPASMRAMVSAKVLAALTPSLLIVAPVIVGVAYLSPRVAAVAAVGVGLAMTSSALLNLWYAKPGNRRDFRRRRSGSLLIGLVETLILFACTGFTWTAINGLYAIAAGLAVAIIAVLVVMRRPLKLSPFG